MKAILRNFHKRRIIVFGNDICMVALAWIGTYLLCFNLNPPYLVTFKFLPHILFLQALSFYFSGLYRGIWRFASIPDLVRILQAVMIGVVSVMVLFKLERLYLFPVPIVYGILLLLFLSGPRVVYRYFKDYKRALLDGKRVLIIGAGSAGESVVRDLCRLHEYKAIALVDDDLLKIGREIHGVRVKAPCAMIPRMVKQLKIELCLIAMPSATSAEMRRIVKLCDRANVPYRTLPSLRELTEGKVNLKELREVSLEDLLGREQINLSEESIGHFIRHKNIVVSGGGGSIGSELCMQIARLEPRVLIIIEHCEYNLYAVDMKLRKAFPELNLQSVLCSVNDKIALENIFKKNKPEIVFHAAAYKHVPLLESQLRIAVYNNIIGTRILTEAAVKYHCEVFVLISTDKAVNPTNIMGATKRAAEVFCQNFSQRYMTRFITVRFGNVLDSAGSVVPLFREQLKAGGPLTVTHPEITRFFMTIPEAAQLIIQAANLGKGGEIFVLDMGEPIKISYLAEQLIKSSGKQLGKDISIKYTGLRAGEKLHEELFYNEEELNLTGHPKIRQAKSQQRSWLLLVNLLNEMELAYEVHQDAKLFNLLQHIVPEYCPSDYLKEEHDSLKIKYST